MTNKIKGNIGENIIHNYCKEKGLDFLKTTQQEDKLLGVDCYINGLGVDVKTTPNLYLFSVYNEKICVHHPFRFNSRAVNYCFVNIETKKIKIVPIYEFLIRNFFKDEVSYVSLCKTLNYWEGKSFQIIENSVSVSQAALVAKLQIENFIDSKKGAKVKYFLEDNQNQFKTFLALDKYNVKNI